jgi:O-methyltransferase involved in polyketide biosynthesis
MLIGGINLNYLSEEEINRLRQNLAAILAPDRRLSVRTGNRMNRPAHDPHEILKDRYYTGLKLLPDIFKNSYRTYRLDEINEVSKETLRKWPSEKARETEERRKKWKEMSPDARREAYKKRAEMAAARRTAEPPAEPQPPAETPPSEYD